MCVTDAIGKVILQQDLEAKPEVILTALGELPEGCLKAIGVEAGVGSYVVRKLRSAGLPIALLEARKASKILSLRRHKTDASDARGLADIVRLADGTVSLVHQKSAESRRLRTQLAARQQLIKQRVAGEHTIRALLREHGAQVKAAYAASSLRRNTEAALAHLSAAEGVDLSEEVLPLLDVCESIRRYCFSLDKRLSALAREHAVCRRFLAVPGVGPITALSFYSAIDDPHRFDRVEDVGCFLGLTPRIRQSGKVHDRPRISKMGNALTRSHLTQAADALISVCRRESRLRDQALAFKSRLGHRRARVAVARKLAIVMLSLWKSEKDFSPA